MIGGQLKCISSSGVKVCSNLFQPGLGWTAPWTPLVRHRRNSVCCSTGYGEGSWGCDDSRTSGYMTKDSWEVVIIWTCLSIHVGRAVVFPALTYRLLVNHIHHATDVQCMRLISVYLCVDIAVAEVSTFTTHCSLWSQTWERSSLHWNSFSTGEFNSRSNVRNIIS